MVRIPLALTLLDPIFVFVKKDLMEMEVTVEV